MEEVKASSRINDMLKQTEFVYAGASELKIDSFDVTLYTKLSDATRLT